MTSLNSSAQTTLVFQALGDPSAPPAIVVHGMAERGDEVLSLAKAASEKYRVFVPDLPGHGASPGDLRDVTIAKLATAIAEFSNELGVEQAVFVGHSLGGVIVTQLAAEYPSLVSQAVLIDPGMVFSEQTKSGLAQMYDSLNEHNFEATLTETLPPILFDERDDNELVTRVMAGMVGIGVEPFVALGRSIISFDGLEVISRVEAPLLCIVNDQPMVDVQAVREKVPEMRIVQVAQTSHQGLVHHPETLDALMDFM